MAILKKHVVASTNVIALDPDVAVSFNDLQAVNAALRGLLQVTDSTVRVT